MTLSLFCTIVTPLMVGAAVKLSPGGRLATGGGVGAGGVGEVGGVVVGGVVVGGVVVGGVVVGGVVVAGGAVVEVVEEVEVVPTAEPQPASTARAMDSAPPRRAIWLSYLVIIYCSEKGESRNFRDDRREAGSAKMSRNPNTWIGRNSGLLRNRLHADSSNRDMGRLCAAHQLISSAVKMASPMAMPPEFMKNILLVSGNRIAPAVTGGQIHTLSIARALARIGHSVHIFSTAGRKEDYRSGNIRRGLTMQTTIEPRLIESTHLGPMFALLQTLGRRIGAPRIWQHSLLAKGIVPNHLKTALQAADIIISDLPYCPPIPGPWRGKPWYLISHNLEHKLLEQGTDRQRRFADWMRAIEAAAPRTYTDIFACAEEDQAFFRYHDVSGERQLPIVRCGVDPRLYEFAPGLRSHMRAKLRLTEEDRLLVFSGSGYAPNVEAFHEIQRFCREEAQFLADSRVYLLVVGSVSREEYREGALIVTGTVPEVVPYFAAADAGLNLVTRGSGSNVKMFEYLASKLPVISTVFGARGAELAANQDYLPCTPEELKATICRFIAGDRAFWRSMAEDVWKRHKRHCDIQDLVTEAVVQLPAFADDPPDAVAAATG